MEVRAQLRYLRLSPKKVRLVANLIRGMGTAEAISQLSVSAKRASRPLVKLVRSAIANAKNNFNLSEDALYIKTITVDQGPTLKRFMPRAHGRASPIRKRTCHVTLILDASGDKPELKDKTEKKAVHLALDNSSDRKSRKRKSAQRSNDQ